MANPAATPIPRNQTGVNHLAIQKSVTAKTVGKAAAIIGENGVKFSGCTRTSYGTYAPCGPSVRTSSELLKPICLRFCTSYHRKDRNKRSFEEYPHCSTLPFWAIATDARAFHAPTTNPMVSRSAQGTQGATGLDRLAMARPDRVTRSTSPPRLCAKGYDLSS